MAKLSHISIRRPVLTMVMNITIIVFGILGFTYLGIREFPSVDAPIVTVSTNYTGANADVIESQITEPLEESINSIEGIRTLTSISRDGRSTITVEFDLEVDMETAANDVRDRVSRSMRQLPPDVDPPIVAKADADASPILFLSIRSTKRNLLDLTDIAINTFKERLQTIPGVSEIRIWGEKKYSMRLLMDPARLAALRVTPVDVQNALNQQNIELPSGRIEGAATELTVRTMGRLGDDPEAFNNMIIKEDSTRLVRFRDIGYAQLAPENEQTVLKRDGIPMVGVVIIPQPGSNHIEIADEFYNRIEQLKKDMPKDLVLKMGFDNTEFIRASISEVQETIFIAFGLVVLIIFLFLRDWRTTVIPVMAIPVSLIGAFFIMYISGFSINVLTLLGIVLAIGLVVDDAIVVLENIYVKIEKGMPPIEAAHKGSSEIFFAVISTTVALAAVFMPVIFLEGITGRLFREFGIVVAGAVIISSFVSLTLTPMMSSRLLKHRAKPNWFYARTEPFFTSLTDNYRSTLDTFLRHRAWAFVIIAAASGLIYYFMKQIPSELAPLEDRSGMRISATGPEGASFEYMDKYMDEMIKLVNDSVPESEGIVTVTSPGFGGSSSVNSGFMRLTLVEPDQRERTQMEIADYLGQQLTALTGARAFVAQEQTIGSRGGGLPVQFVVQTQNFEKLKEVIPKFMEEARKDPTFQFVDINLKFNKPELRVEIDRAKAQSMGVSVRDIAQTLQSALSGQRYGYFIKGGKQYQIIGQVAREDRNDPLDLRSLYVKNNRNELLQLDNFITLSEESTPPQLFRFNRLISATFSAQLAKGQTLGQGIDAMNAIADRVLDESFSRSLAGTSRDFSESSSSLVFAFLLALGLIYLALSAQFESFRDPIIIMFTVPLALGGALLSIWYFNQTLNIFSQIGMIMLVGLVTKNGILIVEFANQRKEHGLDKMEAIKDAAASRFRPILMTSLSTTLGILPIALALGAGAGSRVSMGIAVVGGLIFSTGLTLFVIPAVYSYLSSSKITHTPEEPVAVTA